MAHEINLAGIATPPARSSESRSSDLVRYAGLGYGVVAYVLAIGFWPLFIFFIGNLARVHEPVLSRNVSVAPTILPTWQALAIDICLLAAFGLHHSLLARPAIKAVWWKWVSAPFRRATFSHIANAFAFAIVFLWQPIPIVLWRLDLYSELRPWVLLPFGLGWLMLLVGAQSFNLGALFGLRQVWFWFKGKPYEPVDITTNPIYNLSRHPEFLGVFAGIWFTPDMTVGHLLLASGFTAYSLIALRIKEKELSRALGSSYDAYHARVPMLGPKWLVAAFIGTWLALTGVEIVQTLAQRRHDAQARSDLAVMRSSLVAYKAKTGAYPRPETGWVCEHPALKASYDQLMTTLTSAGVLGQPVAHAARSRKDLGYCYYLLQIDGRSVPVVWASLPSSAISTTGEAGTCRQPGLPNICSRDQANHDYCLCLP